MNFRPHYMVPDLAKVPRWPSGCHLAWQGQMVTAPVTGGIKLPEFKASA